MPRYCDQLGPSEEYITPMGLAASPTFNQFSQTTEFAQAQIIQLDRMLDLGKNEASNGARTGLQCLQDKQLKEKTRRQGIQNAIQARIDEIKQRNEAFKEQVKLVELQMKKTRTELLGSEGGTGLLTELTNPPLKNFPPNCQAIVEKARPNSQGLGLIDLRESNFKPAARSGGEFLANQNLYKNDMQRFINESRAYIAKNGIDSFRENGLPSFKGNQKLLSRISKSLAPFSARIEQEERTIRDELKKVGYDAPGLDKNFKSDFEAFKLDSRAFFRKKAINECVTGANNGITLDPQTILNALRQESTNNQGTTIITYRAAMENILASDSFIEDKIAQLKALDANYGEGNVTVTLSNSQAKLERMPPYMYFQNAVAACVNYYNDDKTFSATSQGRSQALQVERAEAYLNDLKELSDTFVEDMTTEITNDIVNCNGRSAEAGSCTLEGTSFDVSSDNFCFQSASSCATEINNCFAVADQLVKQKTNELNVAADQYNNMVASLFTEQAATFAQFKAAVMQEAGLLNALIPGADFEFPADNFISMPELKLDPETNTYIRGGNSVVIGQQLNAMATKMGQLKDALARQGELADRQIGEYIAEQKKNIEDNKKEFEKLVRSCNDKIAEASNIHSQWITTMRKNEQDARSAAGDFCQRFYDLAIHPNGACGDVEALYESSIAAAQFVDTNARIYANNLRNLCAETQSEREAGTEDARSARENIQADLANSCRDGGNWNDAIQPYVSQYLSSLPEGDVRSIVAEYLDPEGGVVKTDRTDVNALIDDLPEEFAENRNEVNALRDIINLHREGSYDRDSERDDMFGEIGLKTVTNASGATGEVAAQLAIYQDKSLDADRRLQAYETLAEYANSPSTEDTAVARKNEVLAAFNQTAPSAPTEAQKEKAKRVKQAMALLPEISPGDKCQELVAQAAQTALSECISEGSNCMEGEFEDALESTSFRPVRAIASSGLTPGGDNGVLQLFENLGETKGDACDALASNRRNSISDVESLDRQVLGDQYENLLRR